MNLTSPSQVKAWCIENGFHPNKVLGQNFLIDRNQLLAIVDAGLELAAPGPVLEIGPGLGVLTEELLARGRAVTAIEKDPVLAERLPAALGSPAGLTLLAGDALDFVTPGARRAAELESGAFAAMVSNLPYQAGTRILLELAESRSLPVMTALVQTEVAERLAAPEGSRTRSLAGVLAQLDYEVKVVRKVGSQCFWPRPEIGSSVVRLVRHGRNADLSPKVREMYRFLVKRAFEHRRKQLGSVFKDLVKSMARAEELSIDDWVNLAKGLAENEDT